MNYVIKYATKAEGKSKSFVEILQNVVSRMSEDGRLQTVVSKIYYALISERDWSAAEICRLLLNLDLAHSSRGYVIIDCHPKNKHTLLLVSDNDSLIINIFILNKYK